MSLQFFIAEMGLRLNASCASTGQYANSTQVLRRTAHRLAHIATTFAKPHMTRYVDILSKVFRLQFDSKQCVALHRARPADGTDNGGVRCRQPGGRWLMHWHSPYPMLGRHEYRSVLCLTGRRAAAGASARQALPLGSDASQTSQLRLAEMSRPSSPAFPGRGRYAKYKCRTNYGKRRCDTNRPGVIPWFMSN
jgi:hypothetical protein